MNSTDKLQPQFKNVLLLPYSSIAIDDFNLGKISVKNTDGFKIVTISYNPLTITFTEISTEFPVPNSNFGCKLD